jgi:hypothetical protein
MLRATAASLAATLLLAPKVTAKIPEPDHIFYGTVTSYGTPLLNGTVTARLGASPTAVATFVISGGTNAYTLRIPMDTLEPRDPGTARAGDAISFYVNGLLAGTGAVGEKGTARLLNLDEGFDDVLTIEDASVTEGDTGTLNALVNVRLAGAGTRTVSVDYSTADGTARAGSDFTGATGTRILFAPGTTVQTISIAILGDTLTEGPETFLVNLSNAANAIVQRAQATVTIADNEAAPTVGLANASTKEGNTGSVNATFTATLSATVTAPVLVDYATSDGTATAGADFTSVSGTLTIPAGASSVTFTVPILGDRKREANETFKVELLRPTVATLGQATATGTIVDDDAPSADLNGDGLADVLFQQQTEGWIYLWTMDGITRKGEMFTNPDKVPDINWKIRGTGDFNADGNTDLLWQHRTTGELYVWLMEGLNRIGAAYLNPPAVGGTWRLAGTGDFDADGSTDILWQDMKEGLIYLWYMDGLSMKRGAYLDPLQVADTNWKIIGTGDFDLDGQVDIVWQHQTAGTVYAWLMDGGRLRKGQLLSPDTVSRDGWELVAIADYDRDGKLDIMWRNEAAGGWMFLWFMDGLETKKALYTSPPRLEDLNWKIVGPR